MNHAVTVSPKTIEEILAHLNALTKEIKDIKAKLFEKEPLYGSDEWWEKEITKAKREVKAGRIKELDNLNQLDKPLDKLFA